MGDRPVPAVARVSGLVLLALVLGCAADVDGSVDAIVQGQVGTRSSPVIGARITARVVDATSGVTAGEDVAFSDSTGDYSLFFTAFLTAPFTGLMTLEVAAPAASGLRDTSIISQVPFDYPAGVTELDIVLAPSGP